MDLQTAVLLIALILLIAYTAIQFVVFSIFGASSTTLLSHVTTILVSVLGIALAVLIIERQLKTQYEAGAKLQADALRDRTRLDLYTQIAKAIGNSQAQLAELQRIVLPLTVVLERRFLGIVSVAEFDSEDLSHKHRAAVQSMQDLISILEDYQRVSPQLRASIVDLREAVRVLDDAFRTTRSIAEELLENESLNHSLTDRHVRTEAVMEEYAAEIEAGTRVLHELGVQAQNSILGSFFGGSDINIEFQDNAEDIRRDKIAQVYGLISRHVREGATEREQQEYIGRAVSIWNRFPEDALRIIQLVDVAPPPQETVKIVMISTGNSQPAQYAKQALEILARRTDLQYHIQISLEILKQEEISFDNRRTALLRWLSVVHMVGDIEATTSALARGGEVVGPMADVVAAVSGSFRPGVFLRKTSRSPILSAGAQAEWEIEIRSKITESRLIIRERIDPEFSVLGPASIILDPDFQNALVKVDDDRRGFDIEIRDLAPTEGFVSVFSYLATTPGERGIYCTSTELIGLENEGEKVKEKQSSCITTTTNITLRLITDFGAVLENGVFDNSVATFFVGDKLDYRIEVVNMSVYDATNIRVTSVLIPATGLAAVDRIFTGYPSLGEAKKKDDQSIEWQVPRLDGGASAILEFRADAMSSGIVQNRVELTADQMPGSLLGVESSQIGNR